MHFFIFSKNRQNHNCDEQMT